MVMMVSSSSETDLLGLDFTVSLSPAISSTHEVDLLGLGSLEPTKGKGVLSLSYGADLDGLDFLESATTTITTLPSSAGLEDLDRSVPTMTQTSPPIDMDLCSPDIAGPATPTMRLPHDPDLAAQHRFEEASNASEESEPEFEYINPTPQQKAMESKRAYKQKFEDW